MLWTRSDRGRATKPFLIGIAWQGNPGHSDDRWRSFRLAHFAPLAELPGVRLISLQTDHGLDQLEADGGRLPVIDLPGRRGRDFMETAAIMTHLDLVITPDTAVAHLAGGLGLRVWVGLCTVGEWRWPAGRDDSPWYPDHEALPSDHPRRLGRRLPADGYRAETRARGIIRTIDRRRRH